MARRWNAPILLLPLLAFATACDTLGPDRGNTRIVASRLSAAAPNAALAPTAIVADRSGDDDDREGSRSGAATLALVEDLDVTVTAVQALPANKRSVVISGAGDRRDEDIRIQTQILGEAFDEAILFQDACQRGREDGEVLALLQQGLKGATRTKHIEEIRGEFVAIDRALERLQPGDLCLVLVDQVEEALAHLNQRVREA